MTVRNAIDVVQPGVAASAASLCVVRAEAYQARQSVAEEVEKSKKWCVLVHFGASATRLAGHGILVLRAQARGRAMKPLSLRARTHRRATIPLTSWAAPLRLQLEAKNRKSDAI